ncbi:Zinc/iron permease [Fusarium oxysporum]|nr:Zinc/iron permease [Fusarium oxysporum]
MGCLIPLFLSKQTLFKVPKIFFFAIKYVGSGVIIATAFIHLLAPSIAALYSPCLDPDSVITQYPWAEGICLITVFAMFFVELCAPHHRPSGIDKDRDHHTGAGGTSALDSVEGTNRDVEAEVGTTESNSADLDKSNELAAQLSTLFILEFGIIFHSILIGITLAVAGEEFIVLYVVLVFHQTLEGLGLGSRLAVATWPPGKAWLPYFLSALYALSTPIAIAAGLGVRNSITPGTHSSLVVMGVFDAISAGILLYTGLISLIAYDFFAGSASKGQSGMRFMAFGCMCVGAGIMALLGYWA